MKYQLVVSACGVRLAIEASHADLLDEIRGTVLLPGWRQTRRPAELHFSVIQQGGLWARYTIGNGTQQATLSGLPETLTRLSALIHHDVALHSHRRVFVHAGVVRYQDRAVVIPGRSMSGKSSLVKALVDQGASYYSDEYAVIDERGYVSAYPRGLQMRTKEGQKFISPQELGWRRTDRPVPMGALVKTQYDPDAVWAPKKLDPGQAVLALFSNAVAATLVPERVLTLATKAVEISDLLLAGPRGDAQETALAILDQIAVR